MKMTRVLSLVLALVLALGCVQLVNAETAELENVDLIYWCGANPDQKDSAAVLEAMKKVALEGMNVNLDMVIVSTSEIKEKFNKAMAAQERIDLTWTGYVQSLEELRSLGALLPLDELMEQYGQDLIASLDPALLDAHRLSDGQLYQFPAWQGMVGGRQYQAFPKDVVDAAVADPADWLARLQAAMYAAWDSEDVALKMVPYQIIEEMLAGAKEAGKIGLGYSTGYGLASWNDGHSVESVGSFGYVEMYDDTFTVKAKIDRPFELERAKLMGEWYTKGYIREDIASVENATENWTQGWSDPVSDNCYLNYGHNGFLDDLSKEMAGFDKELYTVHTNPYCFTTLGTATGTSIPFTAAEPERAMMFMNWLVAGDEKAKEFYNLYAYGFEGQHYEWNEAHDHITVFGGSGQASSDFDWGQRPWMMGTLLNAYSCDVYPAKYYEDLLALQEVAVTSPLLGFNFDLSDVEIEYNLCTAINKEYDMFGKGYLGTAEAIEAKYEEYTSKMRAAGLDLIIEAIQEQVTAYTEGKTWQKK